MKKRWSFCGCMAFFIVIVWLIVNRTYGMELGGFEIEIGAGTGEKMEDWENGNKEVPEIESEPEIEYEPEVEPVPGIEYKPEVEYVPEVKYESGVEYVPEKEFVPEVKYESEVEYEPEVEYIPEVKYESEVKYEPDVEYMPEESNTLETNHTKNIISKPQTEPVDDTEKLQISPVITKMEITPAMEGLIDDKQVDPLEYFEEETIAEKEKMKPFIFEKQMEAGEIITVQVNGKQSIYILSLRINEKECTWEFTDGKIIIRNETGMDEINIKIMYLSEKEDIHMILTEE